MLRVLTLSAVLAFASTIAFAETFTGRLLDASCAAQQKGAACTPTASTTAFAIEASGKILKLDSDGNKKAAEALKGSNSSADRAKDPSSPDAQVMAKVDGTLKGDEITVETIEVH
ncbi:MAG TPA: hypothetical protein VKR61_01935 [Bryobacteraceae bacterium]|nr:hypothetical protein [Bryobacteraceae bacterium]